MFKFLIPNVVSQPGKKVLLSLLLVLFTASLSLAQTGTIGGEIRDAETGEPLRGATALVTGTSIGASTDNDGRFVLRRVPVGEQTVILRYMGYESQELTVTVEEGERASISGELEPRFVEGDELLVRAVQRGQARSLSMQRESINIRSVVSSEQMDRFADQSVADALNRVAGMGHEGNVNIRGVGAGMTNVQMDGQRMGTTGSDRSFDLSTISADMVQELDVIKVVTPDLDADALSGVVNINTRRPVGGERTMNIRVGSGAQPRYVDHAGPDARFSFSYGDSPDDTYAFAFNFSYHRDPHVWERLRYDWDFRSMEGWGATDILTGLDSEYQFGARHRYGIGGQFTYQPTETSTYHIQGNFNYQDRWRERHNWSQQPRWENYNTPYQTGPTTGGSFFNRYGYYPRGIFNDIHQYNVQFGGRHLFDNFEMEYRLGWGYGHSQADEFRYSWSSQYPGWENLVDIEDRWYPIVDIAPWGNMPDFPTSDNLNGNRATDHRIDIHTNNEVTSSIDFEREFRYGSFKFGGSTTSTFMSGDSERFRMDDNRAGPANYPQHINNQWNVFGRDHQTYLIPFMIDMDKARQTYYSRYPNMQKSITHYDRREIEWYSGREDVLAVYGMSELNFGRFTLLGGLRVEHFIGNYEGKETYLRGELARGFVDQQEKNTYTHLFPNAQLVFGISDYTNFRTAYSRTIGRPNFQQLIPYAEWDYDGDSVEYGNPQLKPMVSENFDILIDHYFSAGIGQISGGVFYKNLSDFVYTLRDRTGADGLEAIDIDPPDFREDGFYNHWDVTTFRNGDEASVYGVEATWQQTLSFLPGFLSYLGTYFTYTYTYSEADIGRTENDETIYVRLEDQRPHIVNAGLDYSRGGFSGQVTYRWGTPAVSSYRTSPRNAPSLGANREYFDTYYDAARDLSATLRYRITSNFRIWVNGVNLLNNRSIRYQIDRDYYPTRMEMTGTEITFGLRYSI